MSKDNIPIISSKDNIPIKSSKENTPIRGSRDNIVIEKKKLNIENESLLKKRKAEISILNVDNKQETTKKLIEKYPGWENLTKKEKKKLRKKEAKGQKKLDLKTERKKLKQEHLVLKKEDKNVVSRALNPVKISFEKGNFIDDVKSSFSLFDQKMHKIESGKPDKYAFKTSTPPFKSKYEPDNELGLFRNKSVMVNKYPSEKYTDTQQKKSSSNNGFSALFSESNNEQQTKTDQFISFKQEKMNKTTKNRIINHLKKSQKFLEKVFDKLKSKINLKSDPNSYKNLMVLRKMKKNFLEKKLLRKASRKKPLTTDQDNFEDDFYPPKIVPTTQLNGNIMNNEQRKFSAEKGFSDLKKFLGKSNDDV